MDVEPIEIVRWRLAPEKGREEDEAGCADRCTQVASPRVSLSLPNGTRLSCGRLARRRKAVGRQPVPARAQHSDSPKAITARQLQALVRRHLVQRGREPQPPSTRSRNRTAESPNPKLPTNAMAAAPQTNARIGGS